MTQQACNRRQFSLASLALGAMACSGGPAAWAQGEGRIVIGQSAALSGAAAQLGQQFQAGAQLAFAQVNAQGGIGRRQIELRSLDDGYEPERCAENTRRFVSDEVLALFGYIGTPTSLAALPLVTQAGLPFIAPFSGAMALRKPFRRQVFHVRASYNDETELIVDQLTHLGQTKIGVFHQNDSYGQAGLDGVTKALAARKLAPVATGTVERNSDKVADAVAKLLAAKPEAIVQIGAYGACAAFIRAARKAGYGGGFYNVSFVGTEALAQALGPQAAGVVVSQVMPSPYLTQRPATREFLEAIKKGGDKVQPNYVSIEGYIAARTLIEGLRLAHSGGKLTRESLVSALEGINSNVAGFPLRFTDYSHEGSGFVEMSMLTGDGRVRI